MTDRPHFLPALALLAALGLAGCGVKGPLEPPPGGNAVPAKPRPSAVNPAGTVSATDAASLNNPAPQAVSSGDFQSPAGAPGTADSATPKATWETGKTGKQSSTSTDKLEGAQRPDRPFFLDWLL